MTHRRRRFPKGLYPISFRSGLRRSSFRLFGCFLIIAAGLVAWPALGQFVPVAETYVIRPVSADVTADNASAAREQALLRAQRSAFVALSERLSPAGQAGPPVPDTATLQSMVQGVEILEEKSSAVRYIGRFAVTFNRQAVRRYFDEAGVSLIRPPETPVVVLPVLHTDGLPILWDGRTNWRTAWEDRVTSGSLLPLMVPLGELQDVAAVTAEEALAGDGASLGRIAEVYSTDTVVVAGLTSAGDGSGRVDLARYENGALVDQRSLSVSVDPGDLEAVGADRAVLALEQAWKAERSFAGTEAELRVRVTPIDGLADWVSVRRRLERERLVVRTDIDRLTRRDADLTLHFRGSRDQLVTAFERLDLVLVSPVSQSGAVGSTESSDAWSGLSKPSTSSAASDGRWLLQVIGPGPTMPTLSALMPRADRAFGDTALVTANDREAGIGGQGPGTDPASEPLQANEGQDSGLPPLDGAGGAATVSDGRGAAARVAGPAGSGTVIDVGETDFRDRVAAAAVPALVYFQADWCSFCGQVDAPIAALAEEMAGQLIVARVDVDRDPVIAQAYDISSVPAFLVMRDADVIAKHQGQLSQDRLMTWVQEALGLGGGAAPTAEGGTGASVN